MSNSFPGVWGRPGRPGDSASSPAAAAATTTATFQEAFQEVQAQAAKADQDKVGVNFPQKTIF